MTELPSCARSERKLLRAVNRTVAGDPVRVLDVLFDCQQMLLPRLMVA